MSAQKQHLRSDKDLSPVDALTPRNTRPYRHTCATSAQWRAAHIAGYALAGCGLALIPEAHRAGPWIGARPTGLNSACPHIEPELLSELGSSIVRCAAARARPLVQGRYVSTLEEYTAAKSSAAKSGSSHVPVSTSPAMSRPNSSDDFAIEPFPNAAT